MNQEQGSVEEKALSNNFFLTGKFYIPETNGLNVFAKGGYAVSILTGDMGQTMAQVTKSIPKLSGFVVAGGVGYNINNFNFFVQVKHNWLSTMTTGEDGDKLELNAGYTTFSGGISYTLAV